MPVTIENGTGIENADSYVSVTEARAYAAARGLTLPVADADVEKLLVKATDYIESEKCGRYKGTRTYPAANKLKWPRFGVVIDGYLVLENEIPIQLKHAQCQLAIELQTVDPTPTTSGAVVKREKVDVIEREFAIDYKSGQKPPVMTKVNLLLQPLIRGGGMIRVVRA